MNFKQFHFLLIFYSFLRKHCLYTKRISILLFWLGFWHTKKDNKNSLNFFMINIYTRVWLCFEGNQILRVKLIPDFQLIACNLHHKGCLTVTFNHPLVLDPWIVHQIREKVVFINLITIISLVFDLYSSCSKNFDFNKYLLKVFVSQYFLITKMFLVFTKYKE